MPGSGGGDMKNAAMPELSVTLGRVPSAKLGCSIKGAKDGRD